MGAVGWSAATGAAVGETDAKVPPHLMQKAASSGDSVAQIGHFFMGTSWNAASLAGKLPSAASEVNPDWQEKRPGVVAKRSRAEFDHGEGHLVVNRLRFDTE